MRLSVASAQGVPQLCRALAYLNSLRKNQMYRLHFPALIFRNPLFL
jgi:hypothetical protein